MPSPTNNIVAAIKEVRYICESFIFYLPVKVGAVKLSFVIRPQVRKGVYWTMVSPTPRYYRLWLRTQSFVIASFDAAPQGDHHS